MSVGRLGLLVLSSPLLVLSSHPSVSSPWNGWELHPWLREEGGYTSVNIMGRVVKIGSSKEVWSARRPVGRCGREQKLPPPHLGNYVGAGTSMAPRGCPCTLFTSADTPVPSVCHCLSPPPPLSKSSVEGEHQGGGGYWRQIGGSEVGCFLISTCM